MKRKMVIHRDGTVTYWSVYEQCWKRRVDSLDVPNNELAAMSNKDRERMLEAMAEAAQCE